MGLDLNVLNATITMTMMSTARSMMIIAPKRKPTISPVLTSAATTRLLLGVFSSGLGVVTLKAVVVGWVVDSVCSGQTGSSRLSRTVLHSLSK